jgi:hypothetical protein
MTRVNSSLCITVCMPKFVFKSLHAKSDIELRVNLNERQHFRTRF